MVYKAFKLDVVLADAALILLLFVVDVLAPPDKSILMMLDVGAILQILLFCFEALLPSSFTLFDLYFI